MSWDNIVTTDLAEDGYAVVTADGSYGYKLDGEIAVGDGFFVKVIGENPSLSYGPQRSRRADKHYINLVASSKYGSDNVIINFAGNNEEGFAKLENFNKDIAEIYVKGEGRRYGILSFEKDVEEIDVYFEPNKMGEYTINAITEGKFQSITLIDRQTGVETDLLTSSYTFKAISNDDSDRFAIRISNNDKFVYQSSDELIINAEGLVQIVDVMGRVIYNVEQNGVNRINVSDLEKSTYIVRNINNNEVKTQKVVIF
jgi:hypothetical protein